MKVAYITNIAPHYRHRLWLLFAGDNELDFHFYFGSPGRGGIKEIDFHLAEWLPFQKKLHPLKNHRFKKILFWQSGVLNIVMKESYDAVIFLGDMNIISTWMNALVLKLKGVPVFFWGHGIYGCEGFIKRALRKRFLSLADRHFVYGNHAKNLMIKMGFYESKIDVVYNSLDYDKHKELRNKVVDPEFYRKGGFFKDPSLPVLIFIGRLTSQKRLDKLINTAVELCQSNNSVNLMIVGDGPEMVDLKNMASTLDVNIFFYGACYNETEIGRLLANATLCVSPGNVGLTAIHNLGFGTPVCTHDDLTFQMPEVEAIQEGVTGTFFSFQEEDMADTVGRWLSRNMDRATVRASCFKIIDEHFNPYAQIDTIKNAISGGVE